MDWDPANAIAQELLRKFSNEVAEAMGTPRIHFQVGGSSNNYFPLRAYASFNWIPMPHGDEDLVVAIDVHGAVPAIRAKCDVSRGSGEVLSEGPSFESKLTESDLTTQEIVNEWLARLKPWLHSQREMVIAELSSKRPLESP